MMHARISGPVVALTGAGISADSGVPTFRGEEGLWRSFRPQDLATPEAFQRDPELVWEWYDWRRQRIAPCEPNAAHHTLAEMEATLPEFTLVTQNVDGLHQAAGSQRVLELHGNIWRTRCTACDWVGEDHRVPLPQVPPRCPACDQLLRPDVVWFGESLPSHVLTAAGKAASSCRWMLVIGTSAVVYPAAALPEIACRNGAHLVEVNVSPTPLTPMADEVVHGPASEEVPRWWSNRRPT
jgi:NAD-dependent deacetylase